MDTSRHTDTPNVNDTQARPIPRRHYRSVEERRRIVEKTLVKGASVARVAQEYGVNANLVFNWRKLYLKGQLGGRAMKLLPATIRTNPSRKRHWSEEIKQHIVEATLMPGACVKEIAQAHGVRASLLYGWRKKYGRKSRVRKARGVDLLPVTITEASAIRSNGTATVRTIEIELPKGRMRIMGADAALLRAALELLR